MSDKILEQLSAFADSELPQGEARLLLARLAKDPALMETWNCYHLAGEAMRRNLAGFHDKDLAARVMAEIADDEAASGRRYVAARWVTRLRPVAGLAVAAGVAMFAVLSLQPAGDRVPSEIVPPVTSAQVASATPEAPAFGIQQVDFSGVQSAALQDQLRGYLLNHNEHTGNTGLRGVMPYVHIAAYDKRPVNEDVLLNTDGSANDQADNKSDKKAKPESGPQR